MLTSLSCAVLATNSIFLALAILTVFLRLLLRVRLDQRFGKDDWFILLALFFTTGLCLSDIVGVPVGHFGDTLDSIALHNAGVPLLKLIFVWQFFYVFGIAAVKLSFLFFYGRFFGSTSFLLAQRTLISLVCAWCIAFFLATILQARPISCNWTDCPTSTVANYPAMYICSSATGILLDLAILALPLLMLRNTRMNSNKKAALVVIFSLGTFCVVASVVRFIYTIDFFIEDPLHNFPANLGNNATNISMWSGIEVAASTVCACLPCFGPYLARIPALRHLRLGSPQKGMWDNDEENLTGGSFDGSVDETRRAGGTKFGKRVARSNLSKASTVKPYEPDSSEFWMSVGHNSTERIVWQPFPDVWSAAGEGKPTRRNQLESEIDESGRISLRTGSSHQPSQEASQEPSLKSESTK